MENKRSNFLVIGGGIAGLSFALRVASFGKVSIIIKDDLQTCSSNLAQGGINAALSPEDSAQSHIDDTIQCGYGLCYPDIVQMVVEGAPQAIDELSAYGVEFTKSANGEDYQLHREGGHSHNRVVHYYDSTGAAIMQALFARVQEHPNITVLTQHMAIDLIVVHPAGTKSINRKSRTIGAYVLNTNTNKVSAMLAPIVYLASGGVGKIYPYTTNPNTATGDGIVMAFRAGVEIVNMEFIQFHPTLLFHPKNPSFLISEAVRGEGGILRNSNGEEFMQKYHPQKRELAPRDVVARAIDSEIKRTGSNCCYLDISHIGKDNIIKHFPKIYQTLNELGIDISKEAIPVVPGAHYCCGGVRINKNGQTILNGLFAGGECAFSGINGANRLASNSLLEAAVFASVSAKFISEQKDLYQNIPDNEVADWVYHNYSDADEHSLISPLWREMRQFMWNYVGIIRSDKRLTRALMRIKYLRKEIEDSYWNFSICRDLVELRNIAHVAEIVIQSALSRKESRGLHYNIDHLETLDEYAKDTIIVSKNPCFFN